LKQKKKKIMFLQTLNIEWGQIDPKDNRRVNVLPNPVFLLRNTKGGVISHCYHYT